MSGRSVLTVEIGMAHVRMGRFVYEREGVLRLTGFGVSELHGEATSESLTKSMTSALNQTGDGTSVPQQVVACLRGQQCFVRFRPSPDYDPPKIAMVDPPPGYMDVRSMIPFTDGESYFDYHSAGTDENGNRIVFACCKCEAVDPMVQAARAIQLNPVAVRYGPGMLLNLVKSKLMEPGECTLVLDFGGKSTDALLAEDQKFFLRSIPIAGVAITGQIAKEFDIDPDSAEELKLKLADQVFTEDAPDTAEAQVVAKIIQNVMVRICGEVDRTIRVYLEQEGGASPTRVLICGGASRIPGLDSFLSGKLNLPVSRLDLKDAIALDDGVDLERVDAEASHVATLAGAALCQFDDCCVKLDFLPRPRSWRERLIGIDGDVRAICLGLAFLIVLLLLFLWSLR